MWHVYMIKSVGEKWHYVGSTNRLQERIKEHNNLLVRSTKSFAPLMLVFAKKFDNEKDARLFEWKLKDCRKAKEQIIKQIESIDNQHCGIV